MKTKILFLLLLSFNIVNAQKKELEKATHRSANYDGRYIVNFDKVVSEDKVASWMKTNGYVAVKVDRKSQFKFGDVVSGVSKVEFMTKRNFDVYMAELTRQANERERLAIEKARREQEQNASWSLGDWAGVIAATVVVLGGAAVAYSAISSSYSSTNSSSYSGNSYKSANDCGCEIESIKDQGWIIKNGFDTMKFKNGYSVNIKYEYNKWRIVNWLSDDKFDTYNELANAAVKDCKRFNKCN